MADSAWVSEAIVEFLRGPMYVHPLMAFIDDKCVGARRRCGRGSTIA